MTSTAYGKRLMTRKVTTTSKGTSHCGHGKVISETVSSSHPAARLSTCLLYLKANMFDVCLRGTTCFNHLKKSECMSDNIEL